MKLLEAMQDSAWLAVILFVIVLLIVKYAL